MLFAGASIEKVKSLTINSGISDDPSSVRTHWNRVIGWMTSEAFKLKNLSEQVRNDFIRDAEARLQERLAREAGEEAKREAEERARQEELQREKDSCVVRIRSDHGTEFKNSKFDEFCSSEGISHEFSSPITPQQNGIVERKNRTIQESARAMIHAKKLPMHFWAEAMNTACYVHNRVTLRKESRLILQK